MKAKTEWLADDDVVAVVDLPGEDSDPLSYHDPDQFDNLWGLELVPFSEVPDHAVGCSGCYRDADGRRPVPTL